MLGMDVEGSDAGAAARLIGLGLRLKLDTAQDGDYRELVARYESSGAFRRLVAEIATGLGLEVTGVLGDAARGKLVLRPSGPNSPFTALAADFSDAARGLKRGVFALVYVAIAAAFWRTAADLKAGDGEVRLTPANVAALLRQLCDRLAADGEGAVLRDSPRLRDSWREIRALPEAREEAKRAGRNDLLGLCQIAMDRLSEQDMLTTYAIGADTYYLPTPRLRLQLCETLRHELHRALLSLLDAKPEEQEEEEPC
ncbi:hypothetical protein [Azospirillum canadense]|uniref:hypothetical protein n=1 Tax=Azospirillum canadense TaxID=403962 RepID=UPI002225EBF0|nr:hypothetical protein [Azospirillum canadense]MCW2241764.1 hypothetical protein [Azospirillum canadense]